MTQAQTQTEASLPDPSHLTEAGADSAKAGQLLGKNEPLRPVVLKMTASSSCVVHFEDHGQDFLRWTITDGKVVDCEPFQEWLWNGTTILSDLEVGVCLRIKGPRSIGVIELKYPVERIDPLDDFGNPVSDPVWTGAEGGVS